MAGLQSENISVASFRTEENDRHSKTNAGLPRSTASHTSREERKKNPNREVVVATHATTRRSQSANVSSWMDKNTCVFCRRSALVSANDPHAPQFAFFALIDCRHYACQPCALVHCDNAGRFIECPQCHCLSRLAQTGRKRSQSAAEANTAFRAMNYHSRENEKMSYDNNGLHDSRMDRYEDDIHSRHYRSSSHHNNNEKHDTISHKHNNSNKSNNRLVNEREVRVSIDDGISSVGSRNSSRYGSVALSENQKEVRRGSRDQVRQTSKSRSNIVTDNTGRKRRHNLSEKEEETSQPNDHHHHHHHRYRSVSSSGGSRLSNKHGSRKENENNETLDGHFTSQDVQKKTNPSLDDGDNDNTEETKRETSPLTSDALAALPIDPIVEERERRIREENEQVNNNNNNKQLISHNKLNQNNNVNVDNNGTDNIRLLDKHSRSRSRSRSPRHQSPSPPAIVGLYTLPSASTTFSNTNVNNNNNASFVKKSRRSTTPTSMELIENARRAKSEPTVHSSTNIIMSKNNLPVEKSINAKSNVINDTVDSINNPSLPLPPPLSLNADPDDAKLSKPKIDTSHDDQAKLEKMQIEDNKEKTKEEKEEKIINDSHRSKTEDISQKEENAKQTNNMEIKEKQKIEESKVHLDEPKNEMKDVGNEDETKKDKRHHIIAPLTERARELDMIHSSIVECQLAENEERQVLIDSEEHQRHRMVNLLDDIIRSYYARRQLAEEFEISPRTPSDVNVISHDSSLMHTEWTGNNNNNNNNNNKEQQKRNHPGERDQNLIDSDTAVHITQRNNNEDNTSHLDSDTFVSPLQETPDQVSATSSDNEEHGSTDMNENDELSVKLSSTRTSRRTQETHSSFQPITHSQQEEEEEEELLNHHFKENKKQPNHQTESVVSSLSSSSRIRPHSAISSATMDDKSEELALQEQWSEKLKLEKQMHQFHKQIETLVDEESVLRLALLETNDSIHSQLMHNCTRVAHELRLQHERVMQDEEMYHLWLNEHIERQLQWRTQFNELVNEEQMHRAEVTVMEASMRVERLAEQQLESVTINAAVEQRERELELREEQLNLWQRQRTRTYTLRVNEIVEDERIERDELDQRERMHWQTHIMNAHKIKLTEFKECEFVAQEVQKKWSMAQHIQTLEQEEEQSRMSFIVTPERMEFIMLCDMFKDMEAMWNEEATNRLNCYRQEQLDWRHIMEEEWNALQTVETSTELRKHTEKKEELEKLRLDELNSDKKKSGEIHEGSSNLPHNMEAEMNYDPVYDDESSDHNSDINEDDNTDIYYNEDKVEVNEQKDQNRTTCQEELPDSEPIVHTNITAVKYYEQIPEPIRQSTIEEKEYDTPLTLPSVTPQSQHTTLTHQANQENNKHLQQVQSDSTATKDKHEATKTKKLEEPLSSSSLLLPKSKSNTNLSSPTITIDNSEGSTTIVLENDDNDNDKADQEIGDTRTILTIHRSGDSESESSHVSNEYEDSFTNLDLDDEDEDNEIKGQRRDVVDVRPIVLAGSCTTKSPSLTSNMSEDEFNYLQNEKWEESEEPSRSTEAPHHASVKYYRNNNNKNNYLESDEAMRHKTKKLMDRKYIGKWTWHARSEWAMQMAACLHHEHVERLTLIEAEAQTRVNIMSDERKECVPHVHSMQAHPEVDKRELLLEETSKKRTSPRRLLEMTQDEEVERMSLIDQERLTRQVIARGKEHERAWMINELSVQRAYLLQRQFQLALMELIRDEDEDRHEVYDNEREDRIRIREFVSQQLQWSVKVKQAFPHTLAQLQENSTESTSLNLLLLSSRNNNNNNYEGSEHNKLVLPWEQLNKIEQLLTRQEEQQSLLKEEEQKHETSTSAIALQSAQETLQDALERLTEAESRLKDEATHRLYAEAERQRVMEASEQLIQQVEAKAERHIAEAREQVQAELQTRLHALRDEVQRTAAQKEMEHELQMEEQRIRLEAKLAAAELHLSEIQDKAMQEVHQARLEAAERTRAEAERMQWASHQREVEFAQRTQIEQLLAQLHEKDVVQRTQLEHHLRELLEQATEAIHVAQREAQRATQLAEERLMQLASQQADRAKEIALASAQVQQVKQEINLFDTSHSLSYSSSSSSSSTIERKKKHTDDSTINKLLPSGPVQSQSQELPLSITHSSSTGREKVQSSQRIKEDKPQQEKESAKTEKSHAALNTEVQTTSTKRVEQIDMATSPMHSREFDYHAIHVNSNDNKQDNNVTTKERNNKNDADDKTSAKEHICKLQETDAQGTRLNEDRQVLANTPIYNSNNNSESTVSLLPLTASALKKAIYDAVSEMNAAHNTAREVQYRVNESIHHSERRFRRRQVERDEAESAVITAETSLETDVMVPIQRNDKYNEFDKVIASLGETDRSSSRITRTNSSSTDASKHHHHHHHLDERKHRRTLPMQSKEKPSKQTTQVMEHASKNNERRKVANETEHHEHEPQIKNRGHYLNNGNNNKYYQELSMKPSTEHLKSAHYEMHNLFITPSSSESPISETSDTSKYFDTESLDCIRKALSRDAYYYTQPHLINRKNNTTTFDKKNKANNNHVDKLKKLHFVPISLVREIPSQQNDKTHRIQSEKYGKDHLYFNALRHSQNALTPTWSSVQNHKNNTPHKEINNIKYKVTENNSTVDLQNVLHYSTLFPLGQSSLALSGTNNTEQEPIHNKVNVDSSTETKQEIVASQTPLKQQHPKELNEDTQTNDNKNAIGSMEDDGNEKLESTSHTVVDRITRSTQVSEHVTPNRPSRFIEGNVILSATQRRENNEHGQKHNSNNSRGVENNTKATTSMEPKTERKKFEAFFVPLYGKDNNDINEGEDNENKKGGTGATPRRPKPPTPCNYIPMKRSQSQSYSHGPISSSFYYQELHKHKPHDYNNNKRNYSRKRFLSAQQLNYDNVMKEDALQEAARAHLLKRQTLSQQQRQRHGLKGNKMLSPPENELREFQVNTIQKHNTQRNHDNIINRQTSPSSQRNAWLRNTERRWQLHNHSHEQINTKIINNVHAKPNNPQTFINSSTSALPPEQLFQSNHHEEEAEDDIGEVHQEMQQASLNDTNGRQVMEQHPREEAPRLFPRRVTDANKTIHKEEEFSKRKLNAEEEKEYSLQNDTWSQQQQQQQQQQE